jgi:hypothetical protein
MKLIFEQNIAVNNAEISSDVDSDGQKRMYISGPFLMYDKKNRNGRIYPKKVMEEAVKEYDKEYIKTARALGEMNHPGSRTHVDPERACILTTMLENDGKNHFYGKAKVLSTPLGKILQNLLEDGVRLGVSSRGLASVSKQGSTTIVQPDFRLSVAADCVYDPSVADAFVDHLMESASYIFVDGMYMEREVFEAQQIILSAPLAKLQEAKLEAFQDFLNKIR